MDSILQILPLELWIQILDRTKEYVGVIPYINRNFSNLYNVWIFERGGKTTTPKNLYKRALKDGHWHVYKWCREQGSPLGDFKSAIQSLNINIVNRLFFEYKTFRLSIPLRLECITVSLPPPIDMKMTKYILEKYLRCGCEPKRVLESIIEQSILEQKINLLRYYYKRYQRLEIDEVEFFIVRMIVTACRVGFKQALNTLVLKIPTTAQGLDVVHLCLLRPAICADQVEIIWWVDDRVGLHLFPLKMQREMVKTILQYSSVKVGKWWKKEELAGHEHLEFF